MFARFLQTTFRRFSSGFGAALATADDNRVSCSSTLDEAVLHVVAEIAPRLRAVPGYARRLREPVGTALQAIDRLVEEMPDILPCRRATYASDPRINAFFVNYAGLQEVFSQNREVRDLFDTDTDAQQCFALLCMHCVERRQLGIAMDGDRLRKDVLQTAISFTDHQLVSPGLAETDARCALKCCIFSNLIGHIRLESAGAATRITELERRAQAWRARLRRALPGSPAHAALRREIEAIEAERQAPALQLKTLDDLLGYVEDTLSNPHRLVSTRKYSLFVDPLGIRCDGPDKSGARELPLTEIRVAGRHPRIACFVSFPRAELLPERDFVQEASFYLSV
ncbi:MAG: hypothetical protein GVY09_19320 [Gammaproteobacteria bacterium]|jgi:hypothetical protein|nr:hypothetical protein [Gammaproteobacteria bacterium]